MRRFCWFVLMFVLAGTAARAETLAIVAARDNLLISDLPEGSSGSGDHVCAGMTMTPAIRRSLFYFDLSAIPQGSVVTSATLDLYVDKLASSASGGTFDVHRMVADWGEGESDSFIGGCAGNFAEEGDATWLYRFFDFANPHESPAWASAGGDFAGQASATTQIFGLGHRFWSSAGMAADVQSWVDDPPTNYGWVVKRQFETGSANAIRFTSREYSVPPFRPTLTVEFDPALPGPVDITLSKPRLSWPPQPGATDYDVVYGNVGPLRGAAGDYAAPQAVAGCLADSVLLTIVGLGPDPAAGLAFWYAVRANGPGGTMSYDGGGEAQVTSRDPGIGSSGAGCP